MQAARVSVEVHVKPGEALAALRREALQGLCGGQRPKELSPRWLYDERGSELFEQITRLPEYYPTRREREILRERSGAIARASRADTLIELGSGSSEKTRLLLDALRAEGRLKGFVPFDVSESFLRQSAEAVAREYPGLAVHAVVGDFEHHLEWLPRGGQRLVAFLGGTVGNLKPEERRRFYAGVSAGLEPGEGLLVGTDLVKARERLWAAYNDQAGVTAAFNRNVLYRLNRELGADFHPEAFAHQAPYVEEQGRVEMWLVPPRRQSVWLRALEQRVEFDEGEGLRTEVSCKFRREQVEAELAAAGLEVAEVWTDSAGDFALWLARKP